MRDSDVVYEVVSLHMFKDNRPAYVWYDTKCKIHFRMQINASWSMPVFSEETTETITEITSSPEEDQGP